MKWIALIIAVAMFLLFLLVPLFGAQPERTGDVAEIMRRVAASQDEARDSRSAFVFQQDVRMRFHRTNGKLAREEQRSYTVAPSASSFDKTLVSFQGQYEKDGRLIGYDKPGYTYKDMDIDGELIDDLADDLMNEKHSRDGISVDLFPLTSAQQSYYEFKLHGTENYRGREVYKIRFKPRKQKDEDWDHGLWSGELLVDTREYQPVLITTEMAKGIPVLVRTLLGTNLKGLGFKLEYEKVAEGAWFPVRYGGEFEIKAVFFYKRRISVGMRSYDFRHVDVATRVQYLPQTQPPQ